MGEDETDKKDNTTQHESWKSVSEKYQTTGISFEKYTHQEYFVDIVKDRRMSKNGVEFLTFGSG